MKIYFLTERMRFILLKKNMGVLCMCTTVDISVLSKTRFDN